MEELLIQQSRIYATTLEDALEYIRDKYGDGSLSVRECNVQPRQGLIWYEFYIEVEG